MHPFTLPLKSLAPDTTFRGTYIHCQMLEKRAGRLGAACCTGATFLPFTATLGLSGAKGSRGEWGCMALQGQQRLQRAVNPTDLTAGSSLSPSWTHLSPALPLPRLFQGRQMNATRHQICCCIGQLPEGGEPVAALQPAGSALLAGLGGGRTRRGEKLP